MSKNRKNKKNRQAEVIRVQQRYDSVMTWIALLFLTIAPVTFRMVRLDFVSPAITNTTSADTGTISDVFTHYKMLICYTVVAALIAIFIAKIMTADSGAFQLTRYDAAIAALCVFLLSSCMLSEYRVIALNGFIYMLDGTVEHICYCALFFLGFHVFSKSRAIKWIFIPLAFVGLVNAAISLLNFLGVNMIDTAIIKTILGLPAGAMAKDAKAFTSTFGNINYLSGFGGVLFAVFFTRLLFSAPVFRTADKPDKKGIDMPVLLNNALSLLMIAASLTIIFTSLSSSGFLTLVIMAPVVFAFALLTGSAKRKAALAALAFATGVVLFIPLSMKNSLVLEETIGMFSAFTSSSSESPLAETQPAETQLAETPSTDAELPHAEGSQPAESRPAELPSNNAESPSSIPQHAAGVERDGEWHADAPPSVWTWPDGPPEFRQAKFELPAYFPKSAVSAGTGRVYIWKHTLKLIAKRPLAGYGMDTLTYAFPQNDMEKVAGLSSYSAYITKPHNVFVGYAYGAGLPALLAFLLLNIFGAISFFRYIIRQKSALKPPDALIMCALLGWAAYIVQAAVNDDLISTAPIWWTLFGIGAGLLRAEEDVITVKYSGGA